MMLDDLQGRLDALLARSGVPGAALAVAVGDELVEVAGGVLHLGTGARATTDSWFQIGSVTKVLTGTLIMQLVDRGALGLDDPVRRHIPGFALADELAAEAVTIRQLLSHTSGIDGDVFEDLGTDDDSVRRYVEVLAGAAQLHTPGAMFSYCNSGFTVLGRIVELHHGAPYATVLREQLLEPLGVEGGTTAGEAIMRRSAVGHVGTPPVPAPVWCLPVSATPAGATPMLSTAGLVAFGRMHIAGGLAADGTRILSEKSVFAMRERTIAVPGGLQLGAMGLAWGLYERGDGIVLGHNGGTIGQYAFLRVHPESGTVVALLTNGPHAGVLLRGLVEPLLAELTGLPTPPEPDLPAEPVPVDPGVEGIYQHRDNAITVRLDGAGVEVSVATRPGSTAAALDDDSGPKRWLPADADGDSVRFLSEEVTDGVREVMVFYGRMPDGRFGFSYSGGRASPRTDGEPWPGWEAG
ncbi:serine hydrolase domain-containing protein [Actinomycetes bacterium KLBMP 9759]